MIAAAANYAAGETRHPMVGIALLVVLLVVLVGIPMLCALRDARR